jgi:hypothetical protein
MIAARPADARISSFNSRFTAQIYAAPAGDGTGSIPYFSSLSPVSQYIENFATTGGTANAFLQQAVLTADPGIPGFLPMIHPLPSRIRWRWSSPAERRWRFVAPGGSQT